jgi:hypothetical protein
MADTRNLSDPFKLPKGNPDTNGKLPGQQDYNKDSQIKNTYKIDIPTTNNQTTGQNKNNPVAIYRVGITQPIGTITSQSGFTPNPAYLSGVSAAEEKIRKAEQRAVRQQTVEINKQAIQPTARKAKIDQPIKSNEANKPDSSDANGGNTKPNSESTDLNPEHLKKIQNAARGYIGRKEKGYPDEKNLRYPEKMNTFQDCIQFTVIEYQASQLGLKKDFGGNNKLRTTTEKRKSLATITLPMPSGGISDRNSVDWQSSSLNAVKDPFADTIINFVIGGAKAGAASLKENIEAVSKDNQDLLKAIVAAKTAEGALNTSGLLSRVFGVQINPNLELLFNGPALRDFSFSFKMTPRSASEAKIVRNIIRTFKQAMSVKRSTSVLLLKSPHTFMIKYLTSNERHPYLNRFKECALTNCSVNYTPDGQYMSYNASEIDERSMTAYELSLTFNELEPIFDDDYDDNIDDASGPFKNIGY